MLGLLQLSRQVGIVSIPSLEIVVATLIQVEVDLKPVLLVRAFLLFDSVHDAHALPVGLAILAQYGIMLSFGSGNVIVEHDTSRLSQNFLIVFKHLWVNWACSQVYLASVWQLDLLQVSDLVSETIIHLLNLEL